MNTEQIKWRIEMESSENPGDWNTVEYPRTEKRAWEMVEEWREWVKLHKKSLRDIRLIKIVTTQEVMTLPMSDHLPNVQAQR
jgi:hypothetical protein